MKAGIAVLFALAFFSLTLAEAYGAFGGAGSRAGGFGKEGALMKQKSSAPQPTGDILLVDGTSFILQTDGASLICRAGGC